MIFNPFVPGQPAQEAPGPLTLATVGTVTEDGATLILPGATAPTRARYPYLGSASIAAGDAVIIARVSGAWVILGKFSGGSEPGPSGDGLPAGGVPGQMLLKTGTADYAAGWKYPQYCRPNLLDNWYFVGGGSQSGDGVFPINQRGNAITTGYNVYPIDRWKMTGYASTQCELLATGLKLTNTSSSGAAGLRQYLPSIIPAGTKLTISVLGVGGETFTNLAVRFFDSSSNYDSLTTSQMVRDGELVYGSIELTRDCASCQLRMFPNVTDFTFEAVKLELGDTQTLAHNEGTDESPVWVLNDLPNWFEELRKCQRYLQWVPAPYGINPAPIANGMCWNTTAARIALPLPVPMIATPTVTLKNCEARIYMADGSAYITPTAITALGNTDTHANLRSILGLTCAITDGINRAQVVLVLDGTADPAGILLSCEPT